MVATGAIAILAKCSKTEVTLLGGSIPIPVLFTLSLVPLPYLVLFFHQFMILSPYLEQIDSQARTHGLSLSPYLEQMDSQARTHGLSRHQAMATTSKVLASNIISQWVFPT